MGLVIVGVVWGARWGCLVWLVFMVMVDRRGGLSTTIFSWLIIRGVHGSGQIPPSMSGRGSNCNWVDHDWVLVY